MFLERGDQKSMRMEFNSGSSMKRFSLVWSALAFRLSVEYISKSLESLGTLTIYAFYIYIVYTCSNVISMLFLPTESYLK